MQSLGIIKQAHILEDSDFEALSSLQPQLEQIFQIAQIFRTHTEMEASVLNDLHFPTPDSKYWQSVREQNVMFNELVMLSYEYRKNQVDIKKIARMLQKEADDLELELLQIEIDRLRFVALNQERVAKDRIREIREWENIKQRLIPEMTCSLTDVNEHQLVSYTQMWLNQLLSAGDTGSIPERNNLLGQLDKGLKLCKERGCIDKVWSAFNPDIKQFLDSNGIGRSDKACLPSM